MGVRGARGSNQYVTRPGGAAVPRPDPADLVAAVTTNPDPDNTPQDGTVRVMVHTGQGTFHSVFIADDGTVVCACGPCRRCRRAVKEITELAARQGWGLRYTAGLHQTGFRADRDVREFAVRWHRNCGVECDAVRQITDHDVTEALRWSSVGASHDIVVDVAAAGWEPQALLETGLCNAAQWVAQGFDLDEARGWQDFGAETPYLPLIWKKNGFDSETAQMWIQRSGVQPGEAIRWVPLFPDPEQARVWHSAWRAVSKKHYYEEAFALRTIADLGFVPADLRRLTSEVAKEPSGLAKCLSSVEGDLDLAVLLASRCGTYQVRHLVRAAGSPTEAREWVLLRFTDPAAISSLRSDGWTPGLIEAARAGGEHRIDVSCGGENHPVTVTWKNGRARWATPAHDRTLEKAAAAFGSTVPPCIQAQQSAASKWSDGNVATPAAALITASTVLWDGSVR